jgi:spore germination protein GerM
MERPRPRLRRLLGAVLVIGLLAGVAACGVNADDEPVAIPAEDLPPDLLDPNPPTSTTLSGSPTTAVTVYLLVRSGNTTRLTPVEREVEDATSRDVINALLAPPSREEQALGLISSIPADTVLLDTQLVDADDELIVDLSRDLFDVEGSELANAFAQIVWTVTELDGVRQVRFRVDGESARAPNAAGTEQPGAVTRADYSALAPR